MNKRFALALTAILCAIAICAAMIPALSVFAEEDEPVWIEGVTATVTDPFHVDPYFNVAYLFDGATEGLGWHAMADGSIVPTVDNPTVITADLNGTYDLWAVLIYPMDFYAADLSVVPPVFELQISDDNGATWETIAAETEAYCIIAGDPLTYVMDEPVRATDFRVLVQSTGPVVDGTILTAFGEIELWGVAVEGEPEVSETQAPAVTETEAPEVTETEAPEETVVETVVESAVEEDSADESEEIVEESAEESADESANETVVDETVADTSVEETVADTTAATDAPAADAEEGCASVVGFGAVAVLAAAAAFVFKKKD